MIILSNPVKLYGKKVITDLISRSGSHTLDSFSYGKGFNYLLYKYKAELTESMNVETFFENMDDFDADVKQPFFEDDDFEEMTEFEKYNTEHGVEYDPAKDPIKFTRYARRLEDIPDGYFERYLGNLVYSLKNNNSNSIRSYNAAHRDQPTLMSNGDDSDDFTELADLLLESNSNSYPPDEKQRALQNLPYVLKRIHNLSCYTKVHMLSFIAAYEKARIKNMQARQARSTTSFLKKNMVIGEGVYLCDNNGYITKRSLVENKSQRMANMFDWMSGHYPEWSAYRKDVSDFIHYCDVLNIDIFNDDMSKYGPEFIDSLVVTVVTPNSQYDRQVFDTILANGNTVKQPEENVTDIITNTMEVFEQICEVHPNIRNAVMNQNSIQEYQNSENSKALHFLFNSYVFKVGVDFDKYSWENGYLYYDGELVQLPANGLSSNTFEVNSCIISSLGYCVHLTRGNDVHILGTIHAVNYLQNVLIHNKRDYKPVPWELCML